CARMGAGGVTPAPTIFSASAATTAPTTSANNVSRRPRNGCGAFAAADGWALPHVTAMTIWIGITQSRKYATHPENVGNENSDTNARAMAITMIVAVTPSAGCLSAISVARILQLSLVSVDRKSGQVRRLIVFLVLILVELDKMSACDGGQRANGVLRTDLRWR